MKDIANKYVEMIYGKLSASMRGNETLLTVNGSMVLYNYELYRTTEDIAYKKAIQDSIANITPKVNNGRPVFNGFGLENGLAGYAWIVNLLQEGAIISMDDQSLAAINKQLVNTAISFLDIGASDYMNGAYGILNYLLSVKQTATVNQYVKNVLDKIVEKRGDSYKVFQNTIIYPDQPDELNLGFSFGISGQLMVLLKACRMGYNKTQPKLTEFIKAGLHFLLSHKIDIDYSEGIYSFFPETINSNKDTLQPTNRLAWFCSDLNHALLLYEAADVFKEKRYAILASYIALQSIQRKNELNTMVSDSSLFAGAAGVAAMFNKLSRYDNLNQYRGAYEFWIERTILFLVQELESNYYGENAPNILNGLSGVSLMLLSYIFDRSLHWEKLFLL